MYRLVSRLIHLRGLMLGFAGFLRRMPVLERIAASRLGIATRALSVVEIFRRDASFSSTSHAPNLVAGPFVIGLESGPGHACERRALENLLPAPDVFARGAQASALACLPALQVARHGGFDLIEDYMLWVTWGGLRTVFGDPAANALESTAGGARSLFEMMRHPGAHLIIGSFAPPRVQERATRMGTRLRQVVQANIGALRSGPPAWQTGSDQEIIGRAVGLLWVAHPATVQAAALVMQEWLSEPALMTELCQHARTRGAEVWSDASFRNRVRHEAAQALKRRPPFPILARDVPRDASFAIDGVRRASPKAGASIKIWPVTAMAEVEDDVRRRGGCPRDGKDPLAALDQPLGLVFGLGQRSCIAGDHAIETLTSGLIGLLTLGPLTWAEPRWRRMRYDGPIIVRMRLREQTA
jgi:hypothetical protein